jgi:DNA topoisomerase-1
MSRGVTVASPKEARAAACAAALCYVSDEGAGIARRRVGKGFSYRQPQGGPLKEPATLRRIRALERNLIIWSR